jgi:hypothetical protein
MYPFAIIYLLEHTGLVSELLTSPPGRALIAQRKVSGVWCQHIDVLYPETSYETTVKSEPQNRRISNIEYRISKGGIALLSLF